MARQPLTQPRSARPRLSRLLLTAAQVFFFAYPPQECEEQEVVEVADIPLDPEIVFHEVVERV